MTNPASLLDAPGAVRGGEELDGARVDAFLKAAVPGLSGTPAIAQFPGGASNLTYLVSYPGRDLVLRRPPAGTKAKSAHDMAREHFIQKALKPVFPVVPTMVALCQDEQVLGIAKGKGFGLGEDAHLDIHLFQFLQGKGRETRILKGGIDGVTSHPINNAFPAGKATDAAAQTAGLVKGHEGPLLGPEGRVFEGCGQ